MARGDGFDYDTENEELLQDKCAQFKSFVENPYTLYDDPRSLCGQRFNSVEIVIPDIRHR
jgi:hypothetical protein